MMRGVPVIGPAVVTLGVFDGVHLGHRQAVAATAAAARARGARSVVLVFHPPPVEIIRPGVVVRRLLPVDLVLERLREAGADVAVKLHFDTDMREMSPEAFLAALAPGIELRGIAMTADSAFGRDRAGTFARVAAIAAERGFDAIEIEPLQLDGRTVSSSRIREALAAGDVALAARLLGTDPLLRGVVGADGALLVEYPAALPAAGTYRGRIGDQTVQVSVSDGDPPRVGIDAPEQHGSAVILTLMAG